MFCLPACCASVYVVDECYSDGGYAFFSAGEAEALGGGGFDGDAVVVCAAHFSYTLLHLCDVGRAVVL